MGKPTLVNPEVSSAEYIGGAKATWGSEPSQYPQEEKTIVIPLVAASERGTAQTEVLALRGCRAHHTELQTNKLVEGSGTTRHRR
jgi:hypothetical protein